MTINRREFLKRTWNTRWTVSLYRCDLGGTRESGAAAGIGMERAFGVVDERPPGF